VDAADSSRRARTPIATTDGPFAGSGSIMSLVINTNVASLNAQRNLNGSQGLLGKAIQRLSSGLRINSAADDAAGLAISDRMTTQITGLNQPCATPTMVFRCCRRRTVR
jgi:hypothetical protein